MELQLRLHQHQSQKPIIMKKLLTALVVCTLALTACNSAKQTASSGYDDVYGAGKQTVQNNVPVAPQSNVHNYSSTPVPNSNNRFDYANPAVTDGSTGNTYVTNNYYDADNYYDYAYSSRIRRFYNPVGLGYYNPYFTNSYWYDYQPASWGLSIYSTYNWWAPSVYYSYSPFVGSGWAFNIGFGPTYNPYWYRPYYYPMGFYNPYLYNSFGGCNTCCNSCYQNISYYNNCPYYYNSYDNTSHYFGNSKGNHTGGSGVSYVQGGRGATLQTNTLGAVYASNNTPVTNNINTTPHAPTLAEPVRNNNINTVQPGKNNLGELNTSGDVRGNTNANTTGGVKPVRDNPAYNPKTTLAPATGGVKPANGDVRGNPASNPRSNTNVIMYTPDPRNSNGGSINSNPRNNSVPSNNDYRNPRNNTVPSNNDFSNPRNNSVPSNSDYSNPRNSNVPSNNDFSNPRNNNVPSNNDFSNPRTQPKNSDYSNPRTNATPAYESPKEVVKPYRRNTNDLDRSNSTPRSTYQTPSSDRPSYNTPKQTPAPRQNNQGRSNPR